MTTKRFAMKMHQINENAKYFALMGYHVTTTFSIDAGVCELTVFYDNPKDKFMIMEHSTLECECATGDNFKWVKMQ